MQFNHHASTVEELLDMHRVINAQAATRKLEDAERTELAKIEQSLDGFLRVAHITPHNTGMVEQLIGCDQVHDHGAQNADDLIRLRVGHAGANKMTLALINPFTQSGVPQVLAAVYIHVDTRPIARPQDIAGHISAILDTPCAPLAARPTGLVFYSISNMMVAGTDTPLLKGAGARLIQQIFPFADRIGMPGHVVLSTLSPLRTLQTTFADVAFDTASEDAIQYFALKHLLTGKNGVQRFHLGNGASIGDIKVRPGATGSQDAVAMVNYIYDRDDNIRAQNRRLFREGKFVDLMAAHLVPVAMQAGTHKATSLTPAS